MENVRNASQPSAGAGRDAIRNGIGVLIGAGIAWLLPEGTEPQVRAATAGIVWGLLVSPGLALWGKWLRGRGIKAVFAVPLVVWLAGCTIVPTSDGNAVAWGRSCVVVENGTVIAESDGLSQVFGDMIRSLGGIAGSVFGAGPRSEDRELKVAEACWGVLESAQESEEPLPD